LLAAIAEDALRGPAAEGEDKRVEAVAIAGGVLALADDAQGAHEGSVARQGRPWAPCRSEPRPA
jgi:hypothetical protein